MRSASLNPLEGWEALLYTQVAPLLRQGYSVADLVSALGFSALGLRYGLCCLDRNGALEERIPARQGRQGRVQIRAA